MPTEVNADVDGVPGRRRRQFDAVIEEPEESAQVARMEQAMRFRWVLLT